MDLRLFKETDMAPVLELANAYAAFDGTTSEADLAATYHFPRGFWVAEDEGKIVGFAYGRLVDVPNEVLERWGSRKVGQVELMAVHPSQRGKGIGRALLSNILSEFKKEGADLVLVNCPAVAADARRLYEDLGFDIRFSQMKKRL